MPKIWQAANTVNQPITIKFQQSLKMRLCPNMFRCNALLAPLAIGRSFPCSRQTPKRPEETDWINVDFEWTWRTRHRASHRSIEYGAAPMCMFEPMPDRDLWTMADGQIINTQHHAKTHNVSIRNEGDSSTMWQAALLVQEKPKLENHQANTSKNNNAA